MSFATEIEKSVSDPRVLIELDIGVVNTQWVNDGAGIWEYNFDASYPRVDDSLLDGFTAATIVNVGSVQSSGILLTQVLTLAEVGATAQTWFFDKAAASLHICFQSYDEPFIHDVYIGVIFGYSYDEFTPLGMIIPQLYEGRIISAPRISIARDPLFFGKLQYGGGAVVLNNMDGELDEFAQNNDIYGNPARVYI